MARKTAKKIIEENMPDLEIVEAPAKAATDSGGQSTLPKTKPGPSLAELRRKYLGTDAGDEEEMENEEAIEKSIAAAAPSSSADEDVEVAQVRPKKSSADPADDPGPRTVIVSPTKGIIGTQG